MSLRLRVINFEKSPCKIKVNPIPVQYRSMQTKIQFNDTDELPDIRSDKAFKAVFTRDTPASQGALSDLISTLIGRRVRVASIAANEPPIDDIRDRSIRFDISCRTLSDELVNIEMSLKPNSCELVRLEQYVCKLFTRQDVCGAEKTYADVKEAYQIAILDSPCLFHDEALVHTFQYYDPLHAVSLEGKSRIVTVELKKAEQIIEKPLSEMSAPEAWAAFFRYLTDRSKRAKINEIVQREEGIAMASEELFNITKEDIEWARELSAERQRLYAQHERVTAWREGRQEGFHEVAKNMKANGISLEVIAQCTGLSPEEIASL